MTDYPADILTLAQSITTRISNRMEASSTLGDAATEVIAAALMAERERCAVIADGSDQGPGWFTVEGPIIAEHIRAGGRK